jgi:hypothetical protein
MSAIEIASPADPTSAYRLMPFRFARLPDTEGKVLVTSEAGEFAFLNADEFGQLAFGYPLSNETADNLEAIQIIERDSSNLATRLLSTKLRTRKSFL